MIFRSQMPPDTESCLIDPKKGRSEQPLPPCAIIVFSAEDLRSFLSCFTSPVPRTHKLYLSEVYTGDFENTPVAVAGPMLGAPQTILVLERMIALGVRKVIAAGWCGSLQQHVKIGDIVLPSSAIPEEGTSSHYPVSSAGPSPDLYKLIKSSLAGFGGTVHEGTVWTTDAPFRETYAKVKQFKESGVLSVDMETSALFAVSSFRNIETSVVLVVSDDLSGLTWVHGFREPVFKQSRKTAVRSTLEAICLAARALRSG